MKNEMGGFGVWKIVEDASYKGYLLSVYKYEETGHVREDYEIRVRKGDGLDNDGEWAEAIYIDHCESLDAALAIGKAFVMGILTKREIGNKMNKYESYALGHYLNAWPENMTYDQIISIMKMDEERDDLSECEMYEGIPFENLAVVIDEMKESLKKYF